MAASITATKVSEPLVPMTITGSGFAASTNYWVTVTDPQGHRNITRLKTDGSGAFSYKYVPQAVGSFTFEARPDVEFSGATTPVATTTSRAK
jgi:hypothetical protein